jgi:FKBP-type peptidyl-prolyl cis-trans isomerase
MAQGKSPVTMNTSPKRGPGHPAFVPTEQQRQFVSAVAGVKMTHDGIALSIINPRTGKPVDKKTLERAFAVELAVGKAKLKSLIGTKFMESVGKGEPWALKLGLRHINGWRDPARAASFGRPQE